ncbi:sulfofructose kinase [Cricetibacter osteomyelitidis]|uniref:Sulfofructose kinase n=1 Tax=Cricetibacter osteomyelitidis TaxID=1521931 RepID=A0A4R2SX40_9PAST|nr:PfkB family carbohydrate kinase [Cricetibacter osteomyelitidis]TCP93471.1 sulfofructose kinase [Cricetibacter osteomyelitidis]
MKIACVGIAVQDRIYYVENIPKQSGKFIANNYKDIGGGPAATAAVAIAKLGGSVDFIGRVGDDDVGKTILAELEDYGVNTTLTKIYRNAKSSQSAIIVDKHGERLIINYPSPDLPMDTDWLHQIDFSRYDVILCDVRWHDGAKYALEQGKKLNIPTVLDADVTPQNIESLVALATHSVFSEPGLKKMLPSAKDSIEAIKLASRQCGGYAYVTQGSKGCVWGETNTLHKCNGFKVEAVDTTGAGDVFHGAFALAIAKGYSLVKTIEFSSAVAAQKCTMHGGRQGIPNLQQVDKFITQNKTS